MSAPTDDTEAALDLLYGDEEICFEDAVEALGFAQIEHAITFDSSISADAYRLYAAYKFYARQGKNCWPSGKLIMRLLNLTPYMLTKCNQELVDAGLITRQRRVNRSSLTTVRLRSNNIRLQRLAARILAGRSSPSTGISVDGQLIANSSPSTDSYQVTEEESVEEQTKRKKDTLPAELDFTAGTQTPAAPTPRRLLGDNGHPPDRRRARLAAINADLAPNQRIPLADAILAETGLTALADVPDDNGDRALNGAHDTAVTLYRMGITTPAALHEVVAAWRQTWQGKEGQPPTNKQLISHASQWLATRYQAAVASDTAVEPALPETFPGMEPDHASHRVT